jgi:hypothetical protein
MAVFLAPIIFLPAVNLMTNEDQINSVQSEPTPTITLFPVFHELYHMPLPVTELQLDVTRHIAGEALPVTEEDTSCRDTVQFLSHEKQEVVQLVFFKRFAGDKVLHTSKESQLKALQQCAELLHDLPCTYPRPGAPWRSMPNVGNALSNCCVSMQVMSIYHKIADSRCCPSFRQLHPSVDWTLFIS